MNAPTKMPITFMITRGILFKCPLCDKPIKTDHHGPYHVSTGDHCPGCGMYYTVRWQIPIESSIVEARDGDEKEDQS